MVSEAGWDWITQGPLAKMEERRWSSRTGSSLGEPVREQGAVVYATLRPCGWTRGTASGHKSVPPPPPGGWGEARSRGRRVSWRRDLEGA